MRQLSCILLYFLPLICGIGLATANNFRTVCFYDSVSFIREGPAHLSIAELEPALQFCNYLVYGYAGIDPETYEIKPLHADIDLNHNLYRTVTALKRKFPQLRVLLSVGGDKDVEPIEAYQDKYLQLLEDSTRRSMFVRSTRTLLSTYGFDGLDLAWQFPKNFPKVEGGTLKKAWRSFKGWFTGPKVVDEKAADHKTQFTALVRELRTMATNDHLVLSLTMLPHVDPDLFIDVFVVTANVDFINLATFDFQTPERNPKTADYPAPIYEIPERNPAHNIDYHVHYWLNHTTAPLLLNIGVPAYGRAWAMTRESGLTGYPPVSETALPTHGGKQQHTPGLLSWPEVCEKLIADKQLTGENAPLHRVNDPRQRYGTYAYRAANDAGDYGLWVGFEDPTTASTKTQYARARGLGGVALFDLSKDDFRGQCTGEKFPILRSINHKF